MNLIVLEEDIGCPTALEEVSVGFRLLFAAWTHVSRVMFVTVELRVGWEPAMNVFGGTVSGREREFVEKLCMRVPINGIPCGFVPMVLGFDVFAEDESFFGKFDILWSIAG